MSKPRKFKLHDGKSGAAITVRIVWGGGKSFLDKIEPNGLVVINLAAHPDGNDQNQPLIEFLSKTLLVSSSAIEVVAGVQSSEKIISIVGLGAEIVQERLLKAAQR
jgi:uncharacterized protein YggU (UPF0235/DUF167 family)